MNEALELFVSYAMPIWGMFAMFTLIAMGTFMMGAVWVMLFKMIRNRIRDGYWS